MDFVARNIQEFKEEYVNYSYSHDDTKDVEYSTHRVEMAYLCKRCLAGDKDAIECLDKIISDEIIFTFSESSKMECDVFEDEMEEFIHRFNSEKMSELIHNCVNHNKDYLQLKEAARR